MKNLTFAQFLEDAKTYKTIPFISHFFADTLTPIQIFNQLEQEAVFLLESKDEQSPWSRYSFIGLTPKYYLRENNQAFLFLDSNKQVISQHSTFNKAFHQALDYIQAKEVDLPIPFQGGAVGAISYDAVEIIEPILHDLENIKSEKMSFVFCETILAYDHHKKELFLIHQISLTGTEDEDQLKKLYQLAVDKVEEIIRRVSEFSIPTKLYQPPIDEEVSFSNVRSNYDKQSFITDVEKIQEYIRSGDVFQTVLSQRFEMDITVSGMELYRVLRMINPSPYLFYLKLNDIEIVGSSPERLVQIQDGHIEIHPIAGTRKRGSSKEEDEVLVKDLLKDEKERAEHFMLVDLARNDIGRVAAYGSVRVPVLMEVGKFSHVMHMISKVTGHLDKKVDPIEALFSSFPAGTVSGAPKIRAMQILKELEPTKREYYAGAIAYLGLDGNIDSCIAIRTMVIKNHKAYVQAGAGIVADSVPELEYEETRNKAKALIKAVAVAEKMFGNREGEVANV
ncbi:anthranilate synthase component I [Anaerobacillus alkaliphilus]|uniref:Anthranilate synthase component 1 n=1 Tax=Anaerobacillus alkaliphilus TaxID=1548597 RepID=A0A4Q0VZC3_9BACI|nr:anthranilate synthase component I [Anaerobacillus alkaliphilus]RXJ03951.1 anthranilate synthase component I [Anaerobacillus alkaliphilus]